MSSPAPPDPYNARVRTAFRDLRYAVDAPSGPGEEYTAGCAESSAGARIELRVRVAKTKLVALRFRVFGCPHLIAAAELCCERFEGSGVEMLQNFSVSDVMATLGVPVEKTGRILLLEDAVRSLSAQIDAASGNPRDNPGNRS